MEKIIKLLSKINNEDEKVIKIMFDIAIKEGYGLKETEKIINNFYNNKNALN